MSDSQVKKGGLKRNAIWMVFGNSIYAACQWVVLISIARLKGPEAVGDFTLALAVTAPIIMFFNCGIRTIIATDHTSTFDVKTLLYIKLALSIFSFAVCIGASFIFRAEVRDIIWIVAASKVIESFSDFCYGYAQKSGELNSISLSLFVRGVISTLTIVIFLFLDLTMQITLLAYTVTWFAVLVFYDVRNVEHFDVNGVVRSEKVMRFLRSGIPLGITTLFSLLGPNIPRYVLEKYYGPLDLGLYSSMAYFVALGNIFIMSIGQALIPILSRQHAAKRHREFFTLTLSILAVVIVAGGICTLIAYAYGGQLIRLLYGERFAGKADVFPVIVVAAIIGYVGNVLGVAVTSAKIFAGQAPAFGLAALIGLVAALVYVPQYGVLGAAYSLVVASAMSVLAPLVLLFIYRRNFRGR
ncbi:lipopolysaccharide biosynthesis protein [Pleomorphomonas sp. PLEO]|uniref:lipopolysaccharide biosynthesis protein n=1 Tax=Pleomorphomonas sp. PLEO TaxID=3239306 RepID=UPI00351F3C4E